MSARTRLGVVVNPTAGRGRGRTVGARVIDDLGARGYVVEDLSASDMPRATANARQAVSDGLDALVVVGGDGMVHAGFNAVATTGVPLGVVAAGSGNDFARAAGLPLHRAARAVQGIDEAVRSGAARRIDAVRVGAPGSIGGRWYAGVLSAGIDAAINDRANRLDFPRGRLRYVRAALGELGAYRPFGYRVTTDDAVWESAGALVAVANGPAIGGGMRIAPDAAFDDGLLDVVLAGPVTRTQALGLFPRLYRGSHVRHAQVEVRRARVVLLEPTGAGAPPPPAFADGEQVGTLPLRLELHPGAVHLLA